MTFASQRFLLGTMADHVGSVPVAGLAAIHVYHWARCTAFWYRRAQVWQVHNWKTLLAGTALNFTLRDNQFYSVLSRVADVALSVVDGIEALAQLKKDCTLFYDLLLRKEEVPVSLVLDKKFFENSILSPSTRYFVKERISEFGKRSELIAHCVLNIFVSLLKLSAALLAAQEGLAGHEFQGTEAVYNIDTLRKKVTSSEKTTEVFCLILDQGMGRKIEGMDIKTLFC